MYGISPQNSSHLPPNTSKTTIPTPTNTPFNPCITPAAPADVGLGLASPIPVPLVVELNDDRVKELSTVDDDDWDGVAMAVLYEEVGVVDKQLEGYGCKMKRCLRHELTCVVCQPHKSCD